MPIFDCHSYLGGSPFPGVSNNGAAITSAMSARGVDKAIVMSAHARNIDPLAGNRILKVTLDQQPNLYGCLITHVNRVETSIDAMKEMMNNRRFLGMAIAGNHDLEPVHRLVADELINAYRRYSKPLFLFANSAEMVEAALDIARHFTMIKIVLLGMGGSDWRAAIAAAHTVSNIYLETSGPLDRAKLPSAVESIGVNRILFGSGSPNVDAVAALGLVQDCNLSDEAQRRILHTNAERLFGLE